MYIKTVGKYLYACHNYIEEGKQKTKSFGRITPLEAQEIKTGSIPSRLIVEFSSWFDDKFQTWARKEHIRFPYDDREIILSQSLKRLIDRCLNGDLAKKAFKGKRFALDHLVSLIKDKEEDSQ